MYYCCCCYYYYDHYHYHYHYQDADHNDDDDGDGPIYWDCAMNNPGPTCYILSTRTCICVGHDSSYAAFFFDCRWQQMNGGQRLLTCGQMTLNKMRGLLRVH